MIDGTRTLHSRQVKQTSHGHESLHDGHADKIRQKHLHSRVSCNLSLHRSTDNMCVATELLKLIRRVVDEGDTE